MICTAKNSELAAPNRAPAVACSEAAAADQGASRSTMPVSATPTAASTEGRGRAPANQGAARATHKGAR